MTNPTTSTQQQDSVTSTVTTVETSTSTEQATVSRVRVKLKRQRKPRNVKWTDETVDNEDMDKKKTKICCIYHKPREFGESSSSSDDSDDDHEYEGKKKPRPSCKSSDDAVMDEASTSATKEETEQAVSYSTASEVLEEMLEL